MIHSTPKPTRPPEPPELWNSKLAMERERLTTRLAALNALAAEAEAPLRQLMADLVFQHSLHLKDTQEGLTAELTARLIDRADKVRDLLAPFDSGTRVEPPSIAFRHPAEEPQTTRALT